MISSNVFSALVALRAKEGEFTALAALDRIEHIRQVQPLIQLEPDGMSPAQQLDEVEAVARSLHEHNRHLMVDASKVADLHSFGGGPAGALGELADRLTQPVDLFDELYPVPFIPVIRSDAGDNHVSVFRHLCTELALGGAVRIRTPASPNNPVERILERLRLDTTDLDIIIDLQYLPEVTARIVDEVTTALTKVTTCGPFRTMSVLSGSIPRTLEQTSIWEQPRAEESLWQKLVQDGVTNLRLGDYGVVHPLSGPGYPSKHVSLKYACPDHWLYSRETMQECEDRTSPSAEPPRARTFREVCRNLVLSDSFSGANFSWGDQQILDAANGRGHALGSTSKPVTLATSHHLAYLAARTAA